MPEADFIFTGKRRLTATFRLNFATFDADGILDAKIEKESPQREQGRRVRRGKATRRLVGVSGRRFET